MAENNKVLLTWKFPEFQSHDRSKEWWVIAIVIVVALLVYSLVTANFLFALIIIMISTIIAYQHFHDPDDVAFSVRNTGIYIDDKHYRWSAIKSFWISYEPPFTQSLYITFTSSVHPNMMIPFPDEIDPIEIRDILGEFIQEDLEQEKEPASEVIGKWLKL